MSEIRDHGKAIAAVAAFVLSAIVSSLTDQRVDASEGVQIAIALVTAVGVYLVTDTPRYRWQKTAVAFALAGLNVAASVITDGVTTAEWLNIVIAALGVLMIGVAPARVEDVSNIRAARD